jgi:hypothetical protein
MHIKTADGRGSLQDSGGVCFGRMEWFFFVKTGTFANPQNCRSADRSGNAPECRDNGPGFRVVRVPFAR